MFAIPSEMYIWYNREESRGTGGDFGYMRQDDGWSICYFLEFWGSVVIYYIYIEKDKIYSYSMTNMIEDHTPRTYQESVGILSVSHRNTIRILYLRLKTTVH